MAIGTRVQLPSEKRFANLDWKIDDGPFAIKIGTVKALATEVVNCFKGDAPPLGSSPWIGLVRSASQTAIVYTVERSRRKSN